MKITLAISFVILFLLCIHLFFAEHLQGYLLLIEDGSPIRIMLWSTALIVAVLFCGRFAYFIIIGKPLEAGMSFIGTVLLLWIASIYHKKFL